MILSDLLSPEAKTQHFDRICRELLLESHHKGLSGVGTLQEKRLHATVKCYLTEQKEEQEVAIDGTKYVADVRVGDDIFEVQTGNFAPMVAKIGYYLKQDDLTVTVVHPVAMNRWVTKVDAETNEFGSRRKSPRHGKASDLLWQMYPLREYLLNPRLRFRILLLETEDFRYVTGKRRGERLERIPLHLYEEISLNSAEDFRRFLPDTLPQEFTVKEFSDVMKIKGMRAYSAVRVLVALGLLAPAEKVGRAMRFRRVGKIETENKEND